MFLTKYQKLSSKAPVLCNLDWGSIWKIIPQISRLSELDVKEVFGQQIIVTVLNQENHTVTFYPKADITIGCPMDFSSFPFDQQKCTLEMEIQRDVVLRNLGVHLKNSSSDILGYQMKVKHASL